MFSVPADIGHTVRVVVTAKNAGGQGSATSTQTAAVTAKSGLGEKAPEPACTVETSNVTTAKTDLAINGEVVCLLESGSPYAGMTISSGPSSTNATLAPAKGAHVQVNGLTVAANHITVLGLHIKGECDIGTGNVPGFHNDALEWDECYQSNGDGVGLFAQVEGPTLDENITVAHDLIHNTSEVVEGDAFHVQGAAHITIYANDIYNVTEEHCKPKVGECHDDIFQAYNAEKTTNHDYTFEKNYVHDVDAEGFFIKDGDVSPNVTVRNNLTVRNSWTAVGDVWIDDCTHNLVLENNTMLESSNIQGASSTCKESPAVLLSHNVFSRFKINGEASHAYSITSEDNLFSPGQPEYPKGSTDKSESLAESKFSCAPKCGEGHAAASDNYQLASNPNNIGINWSPGTQAYGPAN